MTNTTAVKYSDGSYLGTYPCDATNLTVRTRASYACCYGNPERAKEAAERAAGRFAARHDDAHTYTLVGFDTVTADVEAQRAEHKVWNTAGNVYIFGIDRTAPATEVADALVEAWIDAHGDQCSDDADMFARANAFVERMIAAGFLL